MELLKAAPDFVALSSLPTEELLLEFCDRRVQAVMQI
jgi:hypothetical protein